MNMQNLPEFTSVRQRIQEILPDSREIEVLELLPGGWSNRNFRICVDGSIAVIRIKSAPSVQVADEQRYLEIPLAPELWVYDSRTGDMITEWVEGELLVESPIDPETAADYMRQLHEAIPMGVRSYSPSSAITRFLRGNRFNQSLDKIYQQLNWQPSTICGCHNELNDWNVIKTPTGFCTLDWESAGDNDPIFDLVGLCYGLEFTDDEFSRAISQYDASVDSEHVRRTRVLYQLREHAWALDRLDRGSTKPEIRQQFEDTSIEIHRLESMS